VRKKLKAHALGACLFLFLLVVLGNALHLNPGAALLAAATGTPLVIHLFRQRQDRQELAARLQSQQESSRWWQQRELQAGAKEYRELS
jgi:Flp pilus assembly protein TadB